jgi:hypothetical protein
MRLTDGRRLLARVGVPLAAAAACVLLASCATAARGSDQHSRSGVITLSHISTLKSLFNRDNGHPRLVLIFSPT